MTPGHPYKSGYQDVVEYLMFYILKTLKLNYFDMGTKVTCGQRTGT
jgi:hypothetical protein